jgi:hypothetical protein
MLSQALVAESKSTLLVFLAWQCVVEKTWRGCWELDPTQLDPRLLPTSDITAISQTNPSLSGQVTTITPDVDPSRGLVNLPAVPVDTSVAQGCTAGGSQATSEFIVTVAAACPPIRVKPSALMPCR